eukprot:gene7993-biopygen1700
MLLLLEGHVVHFAAPKTNYSKDIEFTRDTPVFATAKAPISFIKGSVMDDRETEMMSVRWRIFTFRHQFSLEEQKTVSPYVLVRAKSSFEKGDRRLYEFVLNRGDKKLNDLLDTVWELETAKEKQERASMSRIDILKEQLSVGCTCEGQWLECALQILHKNCIDRSVFANAIVKLLVMGRGKGRNIYITGPANCGKTFILDPLRVVYDSFLSPATCSYAWLGVENKEVIFLNDFRWSPVILPWADMLLLLEGHVVHFAAPKTNYSKDIEFTRDTPVFATAKAPSPLSKAR